MNWKIENKMLKNRYFINLETREGIGLICESIETLPDLFVAETTTKIPGEHINKTYRKKDFLDAIKNGELIEIGKEEYINRKPL